MKNYYKKFFMLLFLFVFSLASLLMSFCFVFNQTKFLCKNCFANINEKIEFSKGHDSQNDFTFEFEAQGKRFKFLSKEILPQLELTDIQKSFIASKEKRLEMFDKVSKFAESDLEAIYYCYPEIKIILAKLKNIVNKDFTNSQVFVEKNCCKLDFENGKDGKFIDIQAFSKEFVKQIKLQNNDISFKIIIKNYNYSENLQKKFVEKGCFSTNFSTSNEARKNNIKTALSAFDGIILEEGEMLSFNNTTGERNATSGYMPAKIISGGTFTEGFGGGVCQVSTTLYNASLLAGLEIVEVNSHSLPVSYVEPSFDAMVNVGSSDLVVRNNTGGKIIFTTSSKNDICKVKIFGEKNKYKITRYSEKTKIIPAEPDKVETDYLKYGLSDLELGEEKRLSYPKNGFYSNGYLNFYDSNGNLVETKKIRSNRYNPTKGIVVKRES